MLILRREAEQDIKRAFDWYENQRIDLGLSFLVEVERTLEKIEEHPQLYSSVGYPIRRALCRRFPYAVYFLEQGAKIVVLAVLHQRRNPSIWRTRVTN